MVPRAAPDGSRRVAHFSNDAGSAILFPDTDERRRIESGSHRMLREVAMRPLRCRDGFVEFSQRQIGFGHGQDADAFRSACPAPLRPSCERFLVLPGAHQVGHQNAAPQDAQRIVFDRASHLRS